MFPLVSILASTDLTVGSDAALQSAGALAERAGAALHVVHVSSSDDEESRPSERAALQAQIARCLPHAPPEVRENAAVVHDHRFHGILVRAAEVRADLIVTGAPQPRFLPVRLRTPTAERVARAADVPCLVVRSPLTAPAQRLGVATDFSVRDRGALDLARDWQRVLGGKQSTVTLAHVTADPSANTLKEKLSREVARSQDLLDSEPQQQDVQTLLLEGTDSAHTLMEWARDDALQVLVARASDRRGMRRLHAGGSAAGRLAIQAPCSVLLVPPALWRRVPLRPARIAVALTGEERRAVPWLAELAEPGASGSSPLVSVAESDEATGGGAAAASQAESPASEADPSEADPSEADPSEADPSEADPSEADLLVVRASVEDHDGPSSLDAQVVETLETATQPVLVLRDLPEEPPRHIVVAVDTGEIWYEKFGWAKVLLDRFEEARLSIFHAVTLSPSSVVRRVAGGEFVSATSVWLDNAEATVVPAMEAWLWERVHLAGLPEERVSVTVGMQDPEFALSMMVKRRSADLFIVAAHHAHGPGRAALSSMARVVLESGTHPVLAVVDRVRGVAARSEREDAATSQAGSSPAAE